MGSQYTDIYLLSSSAQTFRIFYHGLMSLSKECAIKEKKKAMQLIKLMKQIIVEKHLVRCEFES